MDNVYYLFANGAVTYAKPDKRQQRRRFWRWFGLVVLAVITVACAALLAG